MAATLAVGTAQYSKNTVEYTGDGTNWIVVA